ncbi:MAG: glycosyltransferase family 4 protein [Chloroflexi bacterium]|nr:glycosyltransferase family 4 protein [Chloroflexota bacterium]
MRVAFLCAGQAGAHSFDDGSTRLANDLALAVAAKGHEVHLFEALLARNSGYRKLDGLHSHTVSANANNGKLQDTIEQGMLYYLRSTQCVAGPFDIIHCFDFAFLPVAGYMMASGKSRAFLSVATEQAATPWNLMAANARSWNLEETVDRVVASSASLREKLLSRLKLRDSKVVVVGNGVELDRFSKWVDPGKVKLRHQMGPLDLMLLFVGELSHRCGAELLVECAFGLVREFGALKVVFAGDGPLQPYLRERARVLGIEGSVRFLSFLPDDQVVDLYNACNLALVPSDEKYASKILLEAWCAGKPAVVFGEALPEFAQAGSDVLAVENDSESVREAIRSMLLDPARAKAMGDRAWRKVSTEFSWNAIAGKTIDMYSNAISGRMLW